MSGSAVQGDTLTAAPGTWTNSPTSYAYQWQDCTPAGADCVNISGGTSSTYVLQSTDVGDRMDVVVTATNAGGSGVSWPTSPGDTVAPLPPPPAPVSTVAPTMSGSTVQGDTLTASPGSWSNSPTSYAYQWQDCTPAGADCVNIAGGTSSAYVLGSTDVGDRMDVVVTATNAGGSGVSWPASPSGTVTGSPSTPPSSSGSVANLWVSVSGGSCVRQASAGAEVSSEDCGSLNAAYAAAECGDVVIIDAGSYGEQNIQDPGGYAGGSAQDRCSGDPIVFEAAAGVAQSSVVISEVDAGLESDAATNGASNWTLQGVTVSQAITLYPPAGNIVINDDQTGGYYIDGVNGLTVENSTIGPCYSAPAAGQCGNNIKITSGWQQYVNGSYGSPITTQNVTFEHDTIHDFLNNATGAANAHFECFFLGGGSNILIDSNKIIGCENYGIFMQPQPDESGATTNAFGQVTIQNNWFGEIWNNDESGDGIGQGSGTPNYAIDFGDNNSSEVISNILIRFNSFAPNTGVDSDGTNYPPGTNDYVIGNIGGNDYYADGTAGCVAGVTYAYNIWTTYACSSTDAINATLPYLNTQTGSEDFHLTANSDAHDFVTPNTTNYQLGYDMDGNTRPTNGPRDTGSEQQTS